MRTGAGATVLLLAAAGAMAEDPFADVAVVAATGAVQTAATAPSWTDNVLVRREVYALAGFDRDTLDDGSDTMSRLSLGFEAQKRFSTATRTLAALDYQGRLTYRNRPKETASDPMAGDADRWEYETHNAYADFYSVAGAPGQYNLRAGYFYAPFGLNQQTDTHGTLLQLSNDRLFGSERDWQATFYGALTDDFDYTFGYLLGAGPDHEVQGQAGMAVARLALANRHLFERGLEGGVSVAVGERVDEHAVMRSPSVHHATGGDPVVGTWRLGVDARRRIDSAAGPFTLLAELAAGEDEDDAVFSGLAQADWLHPGRRWGAAAQYRHFRQDVGNGGADYRDERVAGVLTHYFRNDVGNANLHWVALAIERRMRQSDDPHGTLGLVQYYRYW